MKNILILSCKAGEGHNAAAKAVMERIEHEGHRATFRDFFGLTSPKASDTINNSYVRVAQHTPMLFGAAYNLGLSFSRFLHHGHSPIYWACARVARDLRALLESEHFDAIVMTHVFPAIAVTYLRRKGFEVPLSIFVSTDYTCYPFMEEATEVDYFVLAHEQVEPMFLKRGIPREKLRSFGIPISLRFLQSIDREQAREHLGISPKKSFYLVMGGSMGAGHLRTFAKRLYQEIGDGEMAVICGKNDALRQALEKDFPDASNVHIVGFTTEIPQYMAACAVLYTKPGGLTSTEALVTKTPTVHTAPIPGCESDNFHFFTENGLSLPGKSLKRQLSCGKLLAESPVRREQMRGCQQICAKPNSSLDILQLILDHTEDAPSTEAETKQTEHI
jgi:processive 1,2-diacylglycerol beta-glucosyltransferase